VPEFSFHGSTGGFDLTQDRTVEAASLVIATGGWGALALYYSGPQSLALRTALIGAFALADKE